MWKRRCLAVSLIICFCMSMAACGRNNIDIYEQFEGVTEGEGGFNLEAVAESKDSEGEENGEGAENAPLNYDTVGGGVSVFVSQNAYEESEAWYPNIDVFLEDYGFRGQDPFYQYYDISGRLLMVLYYDEESEKGCGIRYYSYATETFPEADGFFGFTFQGSALSEWMGYSVQDYMALTSVYGGNGSETVKNYTEDTEFNAEGRLSHFEAKGIVPELEELGVQEPETILSMDYTYHENGNLKSRDYGHSHFVFPTGMSSMQSYFDEQGRLMYESSYVTHGSVDYYYIYEGDNNIPRYRLTLDFMDEAWMPVFEEYFVG